MAIKSFADQTTSDIFHGLNTKDARRIPQNLWKIAQRKLDLLQRAKSTMDLSLPGLRIHPLPYDRPGFYSIRANDTYRIIFRFENGDAHEVSIENDHGRKTS
jgi:toxin HigB-1